MEAGGGVAELDYGRYGLIVAMTVALLLVVEGGGEDAGRRRVGWHAVSVSHGTQQVTPLDHEGLWRISRDETPHGLGALRPGVRLSETPTT